MKTIKYSVPSMHCNHCIRTITTELIEHDGVINVNANLDTKEVTVDFDSPATPESIEKLMTEINFPVQK